MFLRLLLVFLLMLLSSATVMANSVANVLVLLSFTIVAVAVVAAGAFDDGDDSGNNGNGPSQRCGIFPQSEKTCKAEGHDEESASEQQLRAKSQRTTPTKGTRMMIAVSHETEQVSELSSRFLVLMASCISDTEILLIMPPVNPLRMRMEI